MGRRPRGTGVRDRHLGSTWDTNGAGTIGKQNGMLTIQAAPGSGTVAVWPKAKGATAGTGRWEARIRAWRGPRPARRTASPGSWSRSAATTAVGRTGSCSGSYVPGDKRVRGSVNTLPDDSFTYSRARDLRSRAWHTYAVEVTPTTSRGSSTPR